MTPFPSPNQAGIPGAQYPTENLMANQEKQIRRIRWDGKIDHQFSSNAARSTGAIRRPTTARGRATTRRNSRGSTSTPTRRTRPWSTTTA